MSKKKKSERRAELARSTVASRPQELLRSLSRDMYAEAYDSGQSFTNYLEELDPSHEHKGGLDAFSRVVRASGIVCTTDLARGRYAEPMSAFDRDENTKVLVPELLARFWRRAVHASSNTRALQYLANDQPSGGVMNPFAYSATPRFNEITPAIPLSELIALNTGIDSDTYKSFYLSTDVTQTRMKRVTEAAEIPAAKLVGQEHTIKLHKYGRKLVTSYEILRRMRIDMVQFHIARIAVQAEADKVSTVISALVAGDGNANTAATVYNLTALDPAASAGTLTLKAWLAFKMLFVNPYTLTTVLAQTGPALALQLLSTGSANIPLSFLSAQFGGFRTINPTLADGTALGWTADAPTLKLVGTDRRLAVERVFEIGANIQEVDRYITNQTQVLTMTETEGYDILDGVATKILDINA
jgi:hypothetical protein